VGKILNFHRFQTLPAAELINLPYQQAVLLREVSETGDDSMFPTCGSRQLLGEDVEKIDNNCY